MALLSLFFFFYFAGVGVYIIFLPKILDAIGYTSPQIGIILSIVPLMRFITPFLFLKLFNLSKKIYIYALFVSLFGVLSLFWTIEHFYLLLVNIALFGIANGLIMPYVDAIALEKLKNRYGKSRLWGSIGFMATSLILAKIYDGYKSGLYFYLFIGIAIFVIGFIISLNAKTFNLSQDEPYREKFSFGKNIGFWISIFLMQVSFGFFYSFFTLYESDHSISLSMVSYLWSISIICEVAMFTFQEKILHINTIKLIQFAIIVTIFRWFLLYLFPNSLVVSFITQTFHAFSFALFHSATITYLFKLYQQKKLSMQFYHGISYGLGGFVGSLLAGYFYGKYLFLIAALITLLSFIALSAKLKADR